MMILQKVYLIWLMQEKVEWKILDQIDWFHAPIKKNNYKSFCHVMQKIRITTKDGSVKVAEVNRNILGALNSYSFLQYL